MYGTAAAALETFSHANILHHTTYIGLQKMVEALHCPNHTMILQSVHQSAFHILERLHGAQTVLTALAAFFASFLAKVPHKDHHNALEMVA
jgi:hypothetical protein